MIGGKRLEQIWSVRKREQEHVVAGIQGVKEFGNCGARLRNLGFHAPRGVDQDSNRDRRVKVLAEELNRTLLSVLVQAEVVLGQIRDVSARLIGNGHGRLGVARLSAELTRRDLQFLPGLGCDGRRFGYRGLRLLWGDGNLQNRARTRALAPGDYRRRGNTPLLGMAVRTISSETDATINAKAIDLSTLSLIVFTSLNPKH